MNYVYSIYIIDVDGYFASPPSFCANIKSLKYVYGNI